MSVLSQIEVLYQHMVDAGVCVLEVQMGSLERLKLARKTKEFIPPAGSPLESSPAAQSQPDRDIAGLKVTAPLSGVFFRATSPSAPPYVKEGGAVRAGDVLCIIEAMKVMNEIRAPKSGKISAIVAVNGKHVKKGDLLMGIE